MNAAVPGKRLVFAIPGDIETRSGGYGYDRRVMAELKSLGWQVEHLPLPGGFPQPSDAERPETAARLAKLKDGSLVMIDGLAFGCIPEIVAAEAGRLRLVALVHHPLALETGLSEEVSQALKVSETRALKNAGGIVVTSPATAKTLVEGFEVAADELHVALPGTEPAEPARGTQAGGGDPMIVAVGSLTPRKDHALLIAALAKLTDRAWQCRIIGSETMDPATAKSLQDLIAENELGGRITLTGAISDLEPEYDQADIFALASRYEGYGMAFAEAMARGLPIVACRGGAIPDVVPQSAGILVEPGDLDGFCNALAVLIDDRTLRQRYAAGALAAGRQFPDWRTTALGLSQFLETVQ
jgi:glycosyltransferase involved in cell wall biosynthesis